MKVDVLNCEFFGAILCTVFNNEAHCGVDVIFDPCEKNVVQHLKQDLLLRFSLRFCIMALVSGPCPSQCLGKVYRDLIRGVGVGQGFGPKRGVATFHNNKSPSRKMLFLGNSPM